MPLLIHPHLSTSCMFHCLNPWDVKCRGVADSHHCARVKHYKQRAIWKCVCAATEKSPQQYACSAFAGLHKTANASKKFGALARQRPHHQTNPLPLLFFPAPSLQLRAWMVPQHVMICAQEAWTVYPPPTPSNASQDSSRRNSASHCHRPPSNPIVWKTRVPALCGSCRSVGLSADTCAVTPHQPRQERQAAPHATGSCVWDGGITEGGEGCGTSLYAIAGHSSGHRQTQTCLLDNVAKSAQRCEHTREMLCGPCNLQRHNCKQQPSALLLLMRINPC